MKSSVREFRHTVGDTDVVFSVGKYAFQADAAVTCTIGETSVLATVTMAKEVKKDLDYMPLLVEYEEKFYASGKIKGSRFIKREGKPTDLAIITGRMIDRSIRPLFPKKMRNDVQVVTTVLSYDGVHQPDICALLAASAALALSPVPWEGPVGAVRLGRVNGAWVVNPSADVANSGDIDLLVVGRAHEAVMIEAGADEMPEEEFLKGLEEGIAHATAIADALVAFQEQVGAQKLAPILEERPSEFVEQVANAGRNAVEAILREGGKKLAMEDKLTALHADICRQLNAPEEMKNLAYTVLRDVYRECVREAILTDAYRVNGRGIDEVRDITAEVGVVPRAHGSGLFQRGETQVLSIVTLGAPDDAMVLDTMTEEDTRKHFMHFYNMPSFSVGEIGPNRGPGRRDIGHGALAERAVAAVMPSQDEFSYTTVVVSEVLSSNGSSSMGSASGTSLALMDAGVPVRGAISGIAMGLVTDEKGQGRSPVVLTDIAGMEDEGCDMDFKVAGSRKGITAVQVDIKVHGLAKDLCTRAVTGAQKARFHILDVMDAAIREPRKELSPYAPRIMSLHISPEKIGDLIGPRGKTIKDITERTGARIDVEDSGLVTISSKDPESLDAAREWVEQLTHEVKVGERYDGRVTRIMKFGAFVEIFPGTEGLVHISELANYHVNRVEDILKLGDEIPVIVTEIDEQGRINLSHKRAKSE